MYKDRKYKMRELDFKFFQSLRIHKCVCYTAQNARRAKNYEIKIRSLIHRNSPELAAAIKLAVRSNMCIGWDVSAFPGTEHLTDEVLQAIQQKKAFVSTATIQEPSDRLFSKLIQSSSYGSLAVNTEDKEALKDTLSRIIEDEPLRGS